MMIATPTQHVLLHVAFCVYQNEIVAFGGGVDRVLVNTYYTRGTVALRDLFPDEAQLTQVIAALKDGQE